MPPWDLDMHTILNVESDQVLTTSSLDAISFSTFHLFRNLQASISPIVWTCAGVYHYKKSFAPNLSCEDNFKKEICFLVKVVII